MIFLTSDTHFFHKSLTAEGDPRFTTKRPFKNIIEMNEVLVQNWNSIVQRDDEVFHLGDVCMGESLRWESTLNRLNGKIYLVRGNHDKKILTEPFCKRFEWIKDYFELKTQNPNTNENQMIVMSHYPMLTWNKAARGCIMAHGHSHNNVSHLNVGTTRIDVGVDNPVCNFAPLSLKKLCALFKDAQYVPVDHHGKKEL